MIPKNFIGKPQNYPESLSSAEVKRRFLALLGEFENPSTPLNYRVTDQSLLEGEIVQQRVEYDVAPGESVPAYHLFKKDLACNAPGILSIHAHGGEDYFPVGKAAHCRPDPQDPTQYSYRAALAGFRVLAPDALCFGERQAAWGYSSFFFDEINAHMTLTSQGSSLAWKSVWDNSRALEVLESLGCQSIGAMGWSGGSTQAYLLAAVNEKVQGAACFFSFMTLRHQFFQYRLCHCLYHFLPGMMQAGIDWDQVVALTAPRKLFLAWGAKDEGTPESMYRAFVDALEKRCKEERLPPSLSVYEDLDIGHSITEAMLVAALHFFTECLGATQT